MVVYLLCTNPQPSSLFAMTASFKTYSLNQKTVSWGVFLFELLYHYSPSTQTRTHSRVRGDLMVSLFFAGFLMVFLGFRDPGDIISRPYGRIRTVFFGQLSINVPGVCSSKNR